MERELLKENFEAHGFAVSFFDTKEDAAEYILSRVGTGSVGIGGCMTAKEMGLYEKLSAQGASVYWHWNADGDTKVFEHARDAEFYICSANGASETGELVNIDGTGNRVAATTFGKKKVFFLVGSNKIVPTISDALERAETIASRKNVLRYAAGAELSEEEMAKRMEDMNRVAVVYLRPVYGMAAEVVFIDEELGF